MFRPASVLIVTMTLFGAAPAAGDSASLGAWLERDVVPELADVLVKHPRFKGETIRLATFRDGRPSLVSTALTDAIQRKLRQELIAHQGVRIASDELPQCRTPGTSYVLGVEVMRSNNQSHRVDIAVLDTNESVWVGGVSYTWRGRLSRTEKASFQNRSHRATPGSFDRPVELNQIDQVVESLLAQIQCRTVHLGNVYIATADHALLAGLRSRLIDALRLRSLVEVSYDEADADARLMLALEPVDDRHRLVLKTVDADDRAFERASLFVRAPEAISRAIPSPDLLATNQPALAGESAVDTQAPAPPATANEIPVVEASTPSFEHGSQPAPRSTNTASFSGQDGGYATADLHDPYFDQPDVPEPIGALRESGTCRGTSGRHCTALELEVFESVRVLTFHTRKGAVRTSCDKRHASLSRRTRDYEIQSATGTRMSFYALATKSASIAREIRNFIRNAPGSCRATTEPGRWLARFDSFLSTNEDAIFWRQVDIETK